MDSYDDEKTVGVVTNAEDLGKKDSTTAETISAYFTIAAAASGLISDGYQSYLMTMANVVFGCTQRITHRPSLQGSNSASWRNHRAAVRWLGVRPRWAIVSTTLLIVLGATLGTAPHGAHGSAKGLSLFLTPSRGLTGIGVRGEYPATSTSRARLQTNKCSENVARCSLWSQTSSHTLALWLIPIVLSIAGENHLFTVWRICFALGLYRKGAVKRRVPYQLVLKCYRRTLIGTGLYSILCRLPECNILGDHHFERYS
ncbi:hypothetical protein EDB87DRAFT_1396258 [Lactarius vividus]|nr:hypothetical protein EDB87DRAFT_1396258 [Lactarius vividus]